MVHVTAGMVHVTAGMVHVTNLTPGSECNPRKRQLLVQDDTQYIQALACGDAWIAVGPSDDILSLARRSSLISVAVPASAGELYKLNPVDT
jgi:hypothetical protein